MVIFTAGLPNLPTRAAHTGRPLGTLASMRSRKPAPLAGATTEARSALTGLALTDRGPAGPRATRPPR